MKLSSFNIFIRDDSLAISKEIRRSISPAQEVIYYPELFAVDGIRELIAKAYILMNETVFVIEQADKMTTSAQNALLKLAEEPPEKCSIVLIAQNAQKLLPTLHSRASIFSGFSNPIVFSFEQKMTELAEKIRDNLHAVSKVNILNVLDHLDKEQQEKFIECLADCWSSHYEYFSEYACICHYKNSIRPSTHIQRHLSDLLLALWDIRNSEENRREV